MDEFNPTEVTECMDFIVLKRECMDFIVLKRDISGYNIYFVI